MLARACSARGTLMLDALEHALLEHYSSILCSCTTLVKSIVAYRGAHPNRAVQLRNPELELAECGHRTAAQIPLRNPLGHPKRASALTLGHRPPTRYPTTSRAEKPPLATLYNIKSSMPGNPPDNSLCHLRHTTPFAWGFIYNTTWLS